MMQARTDHLDLVIAGGGTGGHLFPGIAVAQELRGRDPNNRVLFIGTEKPFEAQVLENVGFEHRSIRIEGIKGRGLWRGIRSLAGIPGAVWFSSRILKAFKPDAVLGVGGYASGPTVLAAWLMGTTIALHEQNRLPGLANRILSYPARRFYVSFPETAAGTKKAVYTGNPVRAELAALGAEKIPSPKESEKKLTILIIGGSQGATSVNNAVVDALPKLKDKDRFIFIHQTGTTDEVRVRTAYRDQGIAAEVSAFFNDMATAYRKADMVVCRAGATTVAEITVIGKPAIFVPFPFATDDHQTKNAQALVRIGAAELILQKDLTGERLSEKLEYYRNHPELLNKMAGAALELGRPDAAAKIVDDLVTLIDPCNC